MDEMKIQEDLVYDKTGQRLHGFVNLGDVNDELKQLEIDVDKDSSPSRNIATHVLTLMVRGIFFKMEFPYANFPTQGKITRTVFLYHSRFCHLGVSNWSFALLDHVGSCTSFTRAQFED